MNTAVVTPIWVNPIPGPSGGHVVATTDGAIPRLIMAIKATGAHLVPGGGPKVVRALEEMAFHFRDNDNSLPPFVAPGGAIDYSLNDDTSKVRERGGALASRRHFPLRWRALQRLVSQPAGDGRGPDFGIRAL